MCEVQADYDGAWKELVERQAPAVLAFFFPLAHEDIDWTKHWSFVEQELRPLTGASATGVRFADKLLEAWTKAGDQNYFHIEVQGTPQDILPRRVYTYGYRADDRFELPADHLVILTDDDPDWRPTQYRSELRYSRLTLEFDPVKLLDYAGDEEALLGHENPVGLFVQAHLWSRRTLKDMIARLGFKLRLIRALLSRTLEPGEADEWHCYFDWLLPLPPERKREYFTELRRIAEEGKMPFVSDLRLWALEEAKEPLRPEIEKQVAEAAQERDRAAQERDRAAQERDRAAQERDRAAQERDRAAQRLLASVLKAAQERFGTDELRPLLAGKPFAVVEAVFDALDAGKGLDEVRALIPQ